MDGYDVPRTPNLVEAGVPADTLTVVDGTVYVGGDAQVSLEASRELLQPGEGSVEQYRTNNVVSTSLTKICIHPSSTFNSYVRLSQGLDLAIANFNELGLCFSMARGPTTGCSATITAQTMAGLDGTTGGSLMNACRRANETGELTSSDITALRALYGC